MRALVLGERSRKRDGSFFFVDQFPTKRADFTSTLSSENEKLYDRAEGESGRTRLQEYLHELVIGENTIAAHKLGRRSEAVTGAALKIFAPHAPLHKYLDGDQCVALFRGGVAERIDALQDVPRRYLSKLGLPKRKPGLQKTPVISRCGGSVALLAFLEELCQRVLECHALGRVFPSVISARMRFASVRASEREMIR